MTRAGISMSQVDSCIEESWGFETKEENTMLQDQLDEVAANGIIILPVAYVNGVPLGGTLDFDVVFSFGNRDSVR